VSDGRPLRLGVVGLGRAAGLMIPSLVSRPDVVLTAAADPITAARDRFAAEFGGRTFDDAESLCASGLVDGIYIATPHGQHAADVETAAEHGIHAIVEKPMALTLDDCRRMHAAAARAGTVLVVGHTHAFDPPVALMGRLIASGRYGRLRTVVSMVYTDFLYRPRRPEELDTARGGGIMYNQVPHQLEIVRELTGRSPQSVRAVTGRWDPARPTEGAMSAFLTFDDGAVAQLTYSGYDRFDTDEFHDWVGESGETKSGDRHGHTRLALRANAPDPETERRLRETSGYGGRGVRRSSGPAHEPHFGFLLASCEGADLRAAPDGVTVYADDGVSTIPTSPARVHPNKAPVIDEFYDAVVNGIPARHDGLWATATMGCALALIASAASGREIALDAELAA
jgi:phthalate 4,5-cis-dihydrodiol dehydrogenase